MARTNAWLTIPDPFAAVLVAQAGFASVTLDMQHGLFDDSAASRTLLALAATPARRFVRIAANDPALAGRALDLGADGLIVPLIDSAAEARALAQACRYPPLGARSFGPIQAALRPAAEPEIFAMIETRHALDGAADIARVDGISGLYVGPNDLGLALGLGPGADREEPALLEALDFVLGAARSAGKPAGLYTTSLDYARRAAAMGFDLVTCFTDHLALAQAARAAAMT